MGREHAEHVCLCYRKIMVMRGSCICTYICMHRLIICRCLHIASGQNPVCDLPTLSLAARHACNSGNIWRSQIMIIVSSPRSFFGRPAKKDKNLDTQPVRNHGAAWRSC